MTQTTPPSSARPEHDDGDRGAILPLVLVMVVIGALWAMPVLSYASSIFQANQALSSKTHRVEAVKAGLRLALADPAALYETCGVAGGNVLAGSNTNGVTVSTRCDTIDVAYAQGDDELRIALVATELGAVIPIDLTGTRLLEPATTTRDWFSDASNASETDRVWLPQLPTRAIDIRSAAGHAMPTTGQPCTVFFPGTYPEAVTFDGAVYLASGVYYFEDEVAVMPGADVVVGGGAELGCTSDQEAAFSAENAPSTHNITGLGATWIFGAGGRLIVDNDTDLPTRFVMNRRYVADDDLGSLPSADVSIITVNGAIGDDGVTGIDLDIPGVLAVPLSTVGLDQPVAATDLGYVPSLLAPESRRPEPATDVAVEPADGAVVVRWQPSPAGAPTSYTASTSDGASCSTNGATACTITGLANDLQVAISVTAANAIGDSDPSVTVFATPSVSAPALTVPPTPAPPTAEPYEGAAVVRWSSTDAGDAPITAYTVTADPGGATCTVDATTADPPTECTVTGLDPVASHTFSVAAINAAGLSPASAPSAAVTPATGLGTPPVSTAAGSGPAVIDIEVAGPTTVDIPGYVAVPQGTLRVRNPNGAPISIYGGVLAARFDVSDARSVGPDTLDIGLRTVVVQHKLRITSTNADGPETSVAIVQVNQNGAYAINSWEVQ